MWRSGCEPGQAAARLSTLVVPPRQARGSIGGSSATPRYWRLLSLLLATVLTLELVAPALAWAPATRTPIGFARRCDSGPCRPLRAGRRVKSRDEDPSAVLPNLPNIAQKGLDEDGEIRQVMSPEQVAAEVLKARGGLTPEEAVKKARESQAARMAGMNSSQVAPLQYALTALAFLGILFVVYFLYDTLSLNADREKARDEPSTADICGTVAADYKMFYLPGSTCIDIEPTQTPRPKPAYKRAAKPPPPSPQPPPPAAPQ
mmetsp:Transcript_127481/g.285147  ORF Transcript_127481/g.285147 Transcript_127481/m.285147 type:complete len:260 (+) Transcript_127481:67-846(+)